MIFVVAGNYQQYLSWLHESGHTKKDSIYVDNPFHLKGRELRPEELVFYGTWRDRREIIYNLEMIKGSVRLPSLGEQKSDLQHSVTTKD